MKIRTGHALRRGTPNSGSVAANSIAAAVAAVLAGTSGVARAQDAKTNDEGIEEVVVTGIAYSIARLPGVTAQRIEGRPAAISIRGLGEDYAGALLNGRQVVSSGEGRAAEYDQFPSELVNQVIVYKTGDAAL